MCIHRHEVRGWHRRWTLYGSTYAGGYSMLLSTWERGGGRRSHWVSASPYRQTLVAWHIWRGDGGSWREWPTRRYCGLR
jgi:hypothetical protein